MKRNGKTTPTPAPAAPIDWTNPKPRTVTDLDMAFGCRAMELLPPMAQIPAEFNMSRGRNWAVRFTKELFFRGGSVAHLTPKPGIDHVEACRHIKAILGSFEPKHEHKIGGVAYLFAQWFDEPKTEGK